MSRPGPSPLPTNIKRIRGTERPDRTRTEPKPRQIVPPCPRWLDAVGRAEWRRLAPELERLGLLTELDASPLATLCDTYSRWRKARAVLATKGLTFTTKGTGYVQQRPEVAIVNTALTNIRKLSQEFGLTPSSRTRIEAPTAEPDLDDFEEFRSRGKKR